MNRDLNGEPGTDRLLRSTLRAGASSGVGDDCLDAATAAAWADGRLDRTGRAAVETHVADCARCQALLAALIRTAPDPMPARWWRTRTLQWAVPAAAALSAAIVVWAIVPRSRPAERDRTPAAEPAPVAIAKKDAPPEPGPSVETKAPASVSREESTMPRRDSANRVDALQKQRPAAPAPANEARAKTANSLAEGRALFDSAAPTALAAPPPQAAAESVGALLAKPTAARATIEISSPDARVRWRLVPGTPATTVDRTADNGTTWQAQQTSGRALTAGASPSPSVCWLVGPNGVVLVTADGGESWRSVTFPEHTDLAGIAAADAQTATVTTADGRRFATSDGGQTWARSRP